MSNVNNNISFKGKYALYGDKEKASKAVSHIIANKKENVDYFTISSGNNRLVLVATDENVKELKSKKEDSDFFANIKNALFPKNIQKRVFNLFKYIFSSEEKTPILTRTDLDKIGSKFIKFDYSNGEFSDKSRSTVYYSDGTYQIYGSTGNLSEEKLVDGSIRKISANGWEITKPDGTYEKYSSQGKLKEKKLEDGSIEIYRYSGCKRFLRTKIFPAVTPEEKPLIRNFLYNLNVLSFITESTGRIAKVDKEGNETWLPIDESKIDDGFKEEFKDQSTFIRSYSDGTKEYYNCGLLELVLQSDGTKNYYYKNGNIKQIRKTDGTFEDYYESGVLKSLNDKFGIVKMYQPNGDIDFVKLDDDTFQYHRKVDSEEYTFVSKHKQILNSSSGIISEDSTKISFTTKNGEIVTFNSFGNIVKQVEHSDLVSEKVETKKTRKNLPSFVKKSLKDGAIVDYNEETVTCIQNDIFYIYDFKGHLILCRKENGDEIEFDDNNNLIIETTPLGRRTEYNKLSWSGDYKKVTMPDGTITFYDRRDNLTAKIEQDGTEIRFNKFGQPIEKILPNRKRGVYYYETGTNRLLFITYTDNSIVSDEGVVDLESHTVSFEMKDGTHHIYSSNGKLIAIKLKNGVTNILDENRKLKEKVFKNGTRAFFNQKGILTSKLYTNGIIEEYNERGVITKITDASGDVYEYYYGKLIKAPKNVLIRNQKQRNLYNSARQSLVSTIAWKLSPETKAGLSEHTQGDAYLASIIAKKDFNQKLNQAIKFSKPVDYSEPTDVSSKENIKYLSYLKQSWADIGVEEFSKGVSAAYEIFRLYVESGVDAIQDEEAKQAVISWIKDNPEKNNVLMYSKK